MYSPKDPYREKSFDWGDVSLDALYIELEASLLSELAFGEAESSQ